MDTEMDHGPFIPTQPNPTHKLSNPTQNVINTDTTQPKLPQPNVRSAYLLLLLKTSQMLTIFKKCLTYVVSSKFVTK